MSEVIVDDGISPPGTGSSDGDGKQKCVCCGKIKAKIGFSYCFSCHKKWKHVYDSYITAGFSEDIAKKRATKAYPPRHG